METELTRLLGTRHPLLLAGMAKVSNARLAAEVSRAGGCGVIGGVSKTPAQLRADVRELRAALAADGLPFGVDLLLPQVGGSARKTNKDYTRGKLEAMIDILCEEKPTLFVSAVGVPPKWAVDRLHDAGILVANMVGRPKHAAKALAVGADIIIAQGYEAGGHTGEIATSVLIPQVVDACRGHKNMKGGPVVVVAAGGIYDGRGVAMALALGASGVWVGTRFIMAEESGATHVHQQLVIKSESDSTIRTTLYTGRPARCIKNEYIVDYETNRRDRIKELESQGTIVWAHDIDTAQKEGSGFDMLKSFPQPAGQAIGGISKVQPAREIVEEMMAEARRVIAANYALLRTESASKL